MLVYRATKKVAELIFEIGPPDRDMGLPKCSRGKIQGFLGNVSFLQGNFRKVPVSLRSWGFGRQKVVFWIPLEKCNKSVAG